MADEPESYDLLAELDPGIREAVRHLREAGVQTFESCEGGPGHAFPVPTVRFEGDPSEGFRAFAVVFRKHGLVVRNLRRAWQIENGDLAGPYWELTFAPSTAHAGCA
jgi:hypothetical protein